MNRERAYKVLWRNTLLSLPSTLILTILVPEGNCIAYCHD